MKKITSLIATLFLMLTWGMNGAVASMNSMEAFWPERLSIMSPELKRSLVLTPEQSRIWDAAQEQEQRLRQQTEDYMRHQHAKMSQMIQEEAAKSKPDFSKVLRERRGMEKEIVRIAGQLDKIRLDMFNKLTSEQQQMVFACLEKQMKKEPRRS